MRKKSFINTLKLLFGIQLLLVTLIAVSFAVFTYQSATQEMNTVAENFLDIYATQIENRIRRMDRSLTTILNNGADLSLLESDDLEERNRASVRLSNAIQDIMKIDDSAEMLVIAEAAHGICLDAKNERLSFDRKNEIREFVTAYTEKEEKNAGWKFGIIKDTAYLYKMLIWNGRSVGAFVSADALLATIPDAQINSGSFVLTDDKGGIWGYSGYGYFDEKIGIQITELASKHMTVNQTSVMDGQIYLYAFEKNLMRSVFCEPVQSCFCALLFC